MSLLTIREAAQLIDRTPATVRRYIRSGRLKAEKEMGKFGEEYKIHRDDLLVLGFSPGRSELPAVVEAAQLPVKEAPPQEAVVPVWLYNELLMKHEQILVQYGMIRAGGQKLLEYKADAEAKKEALERANEQYRVLRARAIKEIRFLRKHLRQAEVEVEDRNIEIVLLQEKIKRLEQAASAATIDSFDKTIAEIRQKERAVAQLKMAESRPAGQGGSGGAWRDRYPPGERGDDH
jgi:excisionase family DNA binding protein